MKLGSGVAPGRRGPEGRGRHVGLGTDGVAGSNNDLDMFEAMDFAGKLAKVTALDPTVLPARDLLRMATIDGAKALGLDKVDRLARAGQGRGPDRRRPRRAPRSGPSTTSPRRSSTPSKESDVSLTVVDGKVLWDGRKWRTLDAQRRS